MKPRSKTWMLVLSLTAALAGASALDIDLGNRAVPDGMRFIPPASGAYVVTSPIRSFWSAAKFHVGQAFSDGGATDVREMAKHLRDSFRNACMPLNSPDDLDAYGVDATRGISIAQLDDRVFAVPLTSKDRFKSFARAVFGTTPLTLQSEPTSKKVASITITENTSSGVVICGTDHPRPVDLKRGTEFAPNATRVSDDEKGTRYVRQFNVVPDDWNRSKVGMSCSVRFEDGTAGACECRILDDRDCASSSDLPRIEHANKDKGFAGRPIDGFTVAGMHVLFPEAAVAILTRSPAAAIAAMRTQDNFRIFRRDDTLREARRQLLDGLAAADAVAIGSVRINLLPLAGSAHFAVVLNERRLTARLVLPFQTLHATLLQNVLAPAPAGEVSKSMHLLSDRLELQINDRELSSYLRFVKQIPPANAGIQRMLGNFHAFFESLAEIQKPGRLQVAALGVHDGVPDIAIAIEVSRDDAEQIIFAQRKQFRVARDRAILLKASAKYAGGTVPGVEAITKLLEREPDARWSAYAISQPKDKKDGANCPCEVAPKAIEVDAPDFDAEDFNTATYETTYRDRLIHHLQPAFTRNDELYRFAGQKVDIDALRAGRFRLAAYYSEANHRLIIGSDLGALTPVIDAELANLPRGSEGGHFDNKASLTVDPKWLIAEGLQYPDQAVREQVQSLLLDLGQYRRLEVRIDPRATQGALIATATARYD